MIHGVVVLVGSLRRQSADRRVGDMAEGRLVAGQSRQLHHQSWTSLMDPHFIQYYDNTTLVTTSLAYIGIIQIAE
jgi:hypothetical protein